MSSVSDIKLIRTDFFFFYKNHRLYSGINYVQKKQLHKPILNGDILKKENQKIISNHTEAWVYPGACEFLPREAVKV